MHKVLWSSFRWLCPILWMAGTILLWPDLFMFSKVVRLPEWAHLLPVPWVATWLLWLPPLALVIAGAARFGMAAARLLLLALAGSTIGVAAQALVWRLDAINFAAQVGWVFVMCALPSVVVALVMAAVRFGWRWYTAPCVEDATPGDTT